MEIVIAAVVVALGLAAGLVIAALLLAKRVPGLASHGASAPHERKRAAKRQAREEQQPAIGAHAAGAVQDGAGGHERDTTLENRLMELEQQRKLLETREHELAELREHHVRELERASGMSASQAKHHLLKELEDQVRHNGARLVRQIEEETKREADRRVRNIL